MERKGYNSFNHNLINKYSLNSIFSKRESFCISHKSFLEIILEQIKDYQYHFLSEKNNSKNIIQYLSTFKNNLSSILKEKTNKQKYLEKELNLKKYRIQHELYDKPHNKDKRVNQYNSYNSVDGITYIQENNYKLNKNKINYLNEKQLLENLSFKIENEISKIDFETQKKINLIINLRSQRFYQEEDLEIVTDQKKLKSKAAYIMKKNLKHCQHELLTSINEKIKNDLKANKIKEEIDNIKEQIKINEEYINSKDVIFEESNDYTRSIIINENIPNNGKNVNEKDKEKPNKYKNKGNRKSLDSLHNFNDKLDINSKSMNIDEFNETINKKVIRSLSNKINRINLLNIKDNCKLNINFNFNVNNLNIINGDYNKNKNNYKESLTYRTNSLNEKNYNDKEAITEKNYKNYLKNEYYSDKDEKTI